MKKPSKYKSIPALDALNRNYEELSEEELNDAKKIVDNFVSYFKKKHL